jgi:predicted nucleotidyltransferase
VLLFGSGAKGSFNQYSDIDLLVVVSNGAASKAMDLIHEIKGMAHRQSGQLVSKRLPMFVSPIILEERELKRFSPLYLDFLDYGMVMFERKGVLTNFLDAMRKIKHRREFRPYEVLRWQTAVQ